MANQAESESSINDNSVADELEQDVAKAKDTANSNYDEAGKSPVDWGGGNLKDDSELESSGTGLQGKAMEEKNLDDNKEEEARDVSPVDDGKGGGHFETGGNNEDVNLNNSRDDEALDNARTINDDDNHEGKELPCVDVDR